MLLAVHIIEVKLGTTNFCADLTSLLDRQMQVEPFEVSVKFRRDL